MWYDPTVMRILCVLLKGWMFVSIFWWSLPLYAQGHNVPLEILSQSSIEFTADRSSFTLAFSDFKKDSTTNQEDVTYSVKANEVVRTDDVAVARLDDLFPNIAFQAQFVSYTKRGGNAQLVAAQPGWISITVQDTGIADKVRETGTGKLVDGTFVVRYQAQAIEDQAAGEHIRTLTVTFADT